MAMTRQQLMAHLAQARASGVGNNFRDGKYRLAIRKLALENGFKGERFQATFCVMASKKLEGLTSASTGQPLDINPNQVGTDVDWLCMDLDKRDSVGPGNLRRFMMELFGRSELSDQEYIETLTEMCDLDLNGNPLKDREEPAKGMVIDMETVRVITQKNKKEIVVCRWSHVKQTLAEQEQVKQWLDAVAAQTAQLNQQAHAAGQLPSGAVAA